MGWITALLICFCGSVARMAMAADFISVNHTITDGQTIISTRGMFELGFFSPGASNKRYLGIWYKKIANGTVVWAANRETPLDDTSGILKVSPQGRIVLQNGLGEEHWSAGLNPEDQRTLFAQLLDNGNLVLREGTIGSQGDVIWQSFDCPSNTLLPGMKFGRDIKSNQAHYLTSWKSPDDPSQGDFTYGLDVNGFPQPILRKEPRPYFRGGPWNGVRFSGYPQLGPNPIYNFGFVFNNDEEYYFTQPLNETAPSILVLEENGLARRSTWVDQTGRWELFSLVPYDHCDTFGLCGANGECNIANSPSCGCLPGFVPKYRVDWDTGDWSKGCVRRKKLSCEDDGGGRSDKFAKLTGLKVPDTREAWFDTTMTLAECQSACLKNCSCTAYTNLDIRGPGSGCLMWFGDLFDIRVLNENGQELYVRMAASEFGSNSMKAIKFAIGTVFFAVLLFGIAFSAMKWRKKGSICGFYRGGKRDDLELPLFDFDTIASATSGFSDSNKLGEGGFGPVYKGVLTNGQEIAVKRLSENSRQGIVEFKNEVTYIANLQHRNLVKLLGCCIRQDEKMLVYEFMPNRSLDCFIFDVMSGPLLDWPKRFSIINGVALGLVYLHRDSRLRIVHRDLKAENVLLDDEMNPKISDFGLAKTFWGDNSEVKTKRVVGTYGYMPPEYAIHGVFSTKSDVFSFGVLMLEIVSGRRNRGFRHLDSNLSLLGHAWILFKERDSLQLIDPVISSSYDAVEVKRSIHIALLCVQHNPTDRPDMPAVIMMLGGESTLPQPKQPGFYSEDNASEVNSMGSRLRTCSVNGVTISDVAPR
ncbi:hypothetical protein MLD38_022943 [Melastoma candidum]|uniref:Uncharacterized protein n=1 Tax=Melastoma candidum TaxID=119954 RepID=A0ACB9QNZ6_9MYRT|nr:hypothetical protein MLD38_022943 [Melastoma candidum]